MGFGGLPSEQWYDWVYDTLWHLKMIKDHTNWRANRKTRKITNNKNIYDKPLKLVDHFTYLSCNILSMEVMSTHTQAEERCGLPSISCQPYGNLIS